MLFLLPAIAVTGRCGLGRTEGLGLASSGSSCTGYSEMLLWRRGPPADESCGVEAKGLAFERGLSGGGRADEDKEVWRVPREVCVPEAWRARGSVRGGAGEGGGGFVWGGGRGGGRCGGRGGMS